VSHNFNVSDLSLCNAWFSNSWTNSLQNGEDDINKDEEELVKDREEETTRVNTRHMRRDSNEDSKPWKRR